MDWVYQILSLSLQTTVVFYLFVLQHSNKYWNDMVDLDLSIEIQDTVIMFKS